MVVNELILLAWAGAAAAGLVFLGVGLGRVCDLSCEELACVGRQGCERRVGSGEG